MQVHKIVSRSQRRRRRRKFSTRKYKLNGINDTFSNQMKRKPEERTELPHKGRKIMKRRKKNIFLSLVQLFENSSSILIQSHQVKVKKRKRKTSRTFLILQQLLLSLPKRSHYVSVYILFLFKIYSVSFLWVYKSLK